MGEILNLAIENKDLFTSLMILPILWFFLHQNSKQFNKLTNSFEKHSGEDSVNLMNLNSSLIEIKNSIDNSNKETERQFNMVKNNIGTKQISREDAILLIKKSVLSGSYKKLDYIGKRLDKNNLLERKDIIKRQIDLELRKLSGEEYLDFLDGFVLNGEKLGDLVRTHFHFDEFLLEVFDCIFDEYIKDNSTKLKNVLEVMKFHQSEMTEKIKKNI